MKFLNNIMQNLHVINTGTSNITSLINALNFLNLKTKIIVSHYQINEADCLILPGVGSFDNVMNALETKKMILPIINAVKNNIPILGICIGMQVLFTSSEEGKKKGLNFLNGRFKKLIFKSEETHKVPNTGFREVNFGKTNCLSIAPKSKGYFYFNHTYALKADDFYDDFDSCMHNELFVASFKKNNIFGMQFHPEKSQSNGLSLLKQFAKYCANRKK